MAEKRRAARIKDRIREELMRSLHRDLTDPRLAHIIVTRVEMPDDLQLAVAYVRLESGGDVPAQRKVALAGLKSATGKLRKSIGGALKLRYTPELRFAYDEILDATTRVDALLHEIAAEAAEKKPDDAAEPKPELRGDERG